MENQEVLMEYGNRLICMAWEEKSNLVDFLYGRGFKTGVEAENCVLMKDDSYVEKSYIRDGMFKSSIEVNKANKLIYVGKCCDL